MHRALLISLALIATPALGQTMYKCPNAAGTVNFQQMPCTPTGGGESVEVKKIPAGAGSGMSDSAKAYLDEQTAQRAERNRLAEEEAKRQETLNVERQKAAAARAQARAAEEQAAAQRATARAIGATGRR
jgi:hypothetical protein